MCLDESRDGLSRRQQGDRAHQQIARAERLGNVIVGAHSQSQRLVGSVRFGAHDHNRQPRGLCARAQALANLESRHPGQHQIQNDEVGRECAQFVERLGSVARLFYVEAGLREAVRISSRISTSSSTNKTLAHAAASACTFCPPPPPPHCPRSPNRRSVFGNSSLRQRPYAIRVPQP